MKLIILFASFSGLLGCKSEKKPPVCDTKLEKFKTCLLSQFYSLSCPDLTDQEALETKEFCVNKDTTPALKKQCPQKIEDLQKKISEDKFNKCKRQQEDLKK